MCVFKCVCVDMPIFRSPLLKLCLLVTTAYCIRITVVFYVDTAVGLTGGPLRESLTYLDFSVLSFKMTGLG